MTLTVITVLLTAAILISINETDAFAANPAPVDAAPTTEELQNQIKLLNATVIALDAKVSYIDTIVDYVDAFLDGIILNYNAPTDVTPPVITLTGDNPQTIEIGSGYTELGATTDDSSPVTIDSSAFADAIGTYSILYDSVDLAGNHAVTVTRIVNVIDLPLPDEIVFYEFDNDPIIQDINDSGYVMAAGNFQRVGIKLDASSALVGVELNDISFWIKKFGSPTGLYSVVVRNSSDNIVHTFGSGDSSTLATSNSYVSFGNGSHILQSDDKILFEFSGGSTSNRIDLHYEQLSNPYDGINTFITKYDGSYTDSTEMDMQFKINTLLQNQAKLGNIADGINNGATTGVAGIRDEAYDFDGIDDYVDMGNNLSWSSSTSRTVVGWIYPEETTEEFNIFTHDGDHSTNILVIRLGTSSDGKLDFGTSKVNVGSGKITSVSSLTQNAWNMFYIIYDNSGNGCAVGVNTDPISFTPNGVNCRDGTATTANTWLGSNDDKSAFFDGRIDDVSVFETVLTDLEISTLYNNGNSVDVVP